MNTDSLGRDIVILLLEHQEVKSVRTFGVCCDEIEVSTLDGKTYYIEVGTYDPNPLGTGIGSDPGNYLGDDKNDED